MNIVQWFGGLDVALVHITAWCMGIVLIIVTVWRHNTRRTNRAILPAEIREAVRKMDERARLQCAASGHQYRTLPGVGRLCICCGESHWSESIEARDVEDTTLILVEAS